MPLGLRPRTGAAEMTKRPASKKKNAQISALRTPNLSAMKPRKNIESVMPAVRTITMWWDCTSA